MADDIKQAVNSDVFQAIQNRMNKFTPSVKLEDYIMDNPIFLDQIAALHVDPIVVKRNTLDGINFVVGDRDALLRALRDAKNGSEPAFAEGGSTKEDFKENWALSLTYLSTDGIGFREPMQLIQNDNADRAKRIYNARPWDRNAPTMDMRFAAMFGDDMQLDFAALHASVWKFGPVNCQQYMCNVHIDEVGIVISGEDGKVTVSPSFLHHLINENMYKTWLEDILPDAMIDRLNFNIFSPRQYYARLGVSVDVVRNANFRWTLSASYGLDSDNRFGWAFTTNFTGKHDFLGGGRR